MINGDLSDEEVKAAMDKFTKILTGQGGTLIGVEEWGRRKLPCQNRRYPQGLLCHRRLCQHSRHGEGT